MYIQKDDNTYYSQGRYQITKNNLKIDILLIISFENNISIRKWIVTSYYYSEYLYYAITMGSISICYIICDYNI